MSVQLLTDQAPIMLSETASWADPGRQVGHYAGKEGECQLTAISTRIWEKE